MTAFIESDWFIIFGIFVALGGPALWAAIGAFKNRHGDNER
jgi:hypothetical protein